MPAEPSCLRRNFLPQHLEPILARNNFDGFVAVQATTDPQEADWLLNLAGTNAFIAGVVGWVDLADPDLPRVLDYLQSHRRFCGVRHPVEDETDNQWLLRPAIVAGLRELARRGIPFDLLIRTEHLPLVPELADLVPGLPLVLDHMAKPPIRDGQFEPWAQAIAATSKIERLHVKISGLITETDWNTWSSAQLQPYVQHVWKCFGPDRCMFGSDWPVCLQAGTWKQVLAAFTQALGPVPKEIRAGVMGANAARFYKLQVGT